MATRSKDISDLPRKGSKYWTEVDADVKLHTLHYQECKHEFAFNTTNEVECKKCHIGFFLGTRGSLKDGHVYIDGKLAV